MSKTVEKVISLALGVIVETTFAVATQPWQPNQFGDFSPRPLLWYALHLPFAWLVPLPREFKFVGAAVLMALFWAIAFHAIFFRKKSNR